MTNPVDVLHTPVAFVDREQEKVAYVNRGFQSWFGVSVGDSASSFFETIELSRDRLHAATEDKPTTVQTQAKGAKKRTFAAQVVVRPGHWDGLDVWILEASDQRRAAESKSDARVVLQGHRAQ